MNQTLRKLLKPEKPPQPRKSGTKRHEVNKVYITDVKAVPRLAFIELNISPETAPENHTPIRALHDGGCAKTIISLQLYHKLRETNRIEIIKPEVRTVIVSCTGEQQDVMGSVNLIMHFQGMNQVHKSFRINAMVSDNIAHQMFLGRDFTGSEAKAFETNNHLYLTDKYGIYWDPVRTALRNKTLCKVPIISSQSTSINVGANKLTILAPQTTTLVETTLQRSEKRRYTLPIQGRGTTQYVVNSSSIPKAHSPPYLLQYTTPNRVYIPMHNSHHEEIIIDQGDRVAQIDLFEGEYEVHNLQMKEDFRTQATYQCNEGRPSFIDEDESMNDEEKEEAFMDYMRKGYHHPSMTKIVEDKAALTELYLKSTKPVKDEDFEAQFDLKHLNHKDRKKALAMFRSHMKAFSQHACDLGCSKDIKMKIPVTTEEPHIQKYVPIPHNVRTQVKHILDQMLEFNIIRECNEPSSFCSNLLVTKKKDGTSIRILLDGRLLNNHTQRLPTNLVTHPELYAQLVGKTHVTTIDLSDAFFQIPLHEDSQPLTCFYSQAHGKRYCFTRCPQGLKNSPLALKLLMDKLFGDLAEDVIHYADDIMIATNGTLDEHMEIISRVLGRLEKGQIKIRPSKINMARPTIEFLGVIWSKDKISVPEAKVLAFKNLPSPTTPKKAKSVACALSYYRKFIPNFSDLAHPLMELGNVHPTQFKWTETHERCFRTLIDRLCKNCTLHLPDPEKPYYVQTDASQLCGGGRVFQKDDNGDELLLACISRTFNTAERSYSTVKKEVLALLYTLKSMDFFLRYANEVILLIDAQAICFLRLCRESSGILLRFSLELAKYNTKIIHVPGKDNEIADVLSRHHTKVDQLMQEAKEHPPLSENQTVQILQRLRLREGEEFSPEEVSWMLDAPSLTSPTGKKKKSTAKTGERQVKNCPTTLHNRKIKLPKEANYAPGAKLPKTKRYPVNFNDTISYTDFRTASQAVLTGILTPAEFKEAQLNDEYCQDILRALKRKTGKPKAFQIESNLLYYKGRFNHKLVLPASLFDAIINSKHFSVFGLHFSKARIERDIRARYHCNFRALKQKLNQLKASCLICQFNKNPDQEHTLKQADYIHAPRVTWAIDLMPSMPPTKSGHTGALLAIDLFTGYIQIHPIKTRRVEDLIEAIEATIIRPFGIPKFLRSDNEVSLLTSPEFYKYLEPMGIKFLPTSVASPWANSHAERAIRTVKDAARNFLLQEKDKENWDKYTKYFTAGHNQSTSVYNYAPESLMFGYTKPNANDLLQFWPNAKNHSEYAEKIIPIAERNRKTSQLRANKGKESSRSYKNQSRTDKTFRNGMIVAHRQLQYSTGPGSSLKPKYTGPYIILEIDQDGSSVTMEHINSNKQIKAHFSNITPIGFHPKHNRVHEKFDEDLTNMLSKKQTLGVIRANYKPDQDNNPKRMLALFKDENNQQDDDFLNTMYDTEEPDPTQDPDIMDPNSRFGTMDPDSNELEDFDLSTLRPQNLNRDSPYPTYQPIDNSDDESTQGLDEQDNDDTIEPQSDLEVNEYDSDTTLHTDEDLRETMFDVNTSDEEENETSENFYLGTDANSTKDNGTDKANQTSPDHGTDDQIQPTKHGTEIQVQKMARMTTYTSLVTLPRHHFF